MNNTKLTDFSAEELQDLLNQVVISIKFLEKEPIFNYGKRIENLKLWQVQILNAISTVQLREREISN